MSFDYSPKVILFSRILNVSPFLLAGCDESISLLLDHIKHVDKVDVKAQTPLFVAMVNKHWSSGR